MHLKGMTNLQEVAGRYAEFSVFALPDLVEGRYFQLISLPMYICYTQFRITP